MLKRVRKEQTMEELNRDLAQELSEARTYLEIILTHWSKDKILLPATISVDFKNAYDFMLRETSLNHYRD